MNTRVIAIDPGKSGSLVWLADDGKPVIHKTKDVDPFDALQDATSGGVSAVCYMERVGGFTGEGQPGSAMFNFGDNYGYWRGLLRAMGVRTILVTPQTWQKGLPGMVSLKGKANKSARKNALRDEAGRRYPMVRATQDNADALLLADYGRRQELGSK